MLGNKGLRGGLASFLFQYLLQAGLFFAVPLFLSVAVGLTAIDTGLRILPLSLALLLAAVGVPKFFPYASPRRAVQLGSLSLFARIVALVAALDVGVGPEVVTWPMLLAGLGIGALASQLGSVTVSAVADDQSTEVGRPAEHGHVAWSLDRDRPCRGRAYPRSRRPSSTESRRTLPSRMNLLRKRRSSWHRACRSSPTRTWAPRSPTQA